MDITFTLQTTYTGSTYNAGPFNISGTTCEGTEYILATGVTKNQLITGYTVSTIYETISGGTIASVGDCTTTQNWLTGINCASGTTHTFLLYCTIKYPFLINIFSLFELTRIKRIPEDHP